MSTAMYVRVSTQQQSQTQTIEQQLERLQHYAKTQNWEIQPEQIFRDDGYSGARLKRPGLDQLRDEVAMAKVERILLTAPDRLSRNFVHQTLLIEEFQSHGVRVEFLDRPMSEDPHDQLLLQIRGAVAEYERTLIAERMRRGRLRKLQAGTLLPWSHPPYGYSSSLDHPRDAAGISVNPVEAAVVGEIFNRYTQPGMSLAQLSKHLYDLGICSPRGKRAWTSGTLRLILTNPVYIGKVFANREQSAPAQQRRSPLQPVGERGSVRLRDASEWILVTQIEAIVSPELFETVQIKLQHNRQTAKRNNKTHNYLLRSLVSCGCCQTACTGVTRNQKYRYYRCRQKSEVKRLKEGKSCSARYTPAQQLEALVWQDLCHVLKHPETIAHAMERLQDGQWLPQELQARCATLHKAQKSLQQQIERLTQAYLAEVIALEEYRRRRADLETQLQALTTQERQLTAQSHQHIEMTQLAQGAEAFCHRIQQGLEQATFEQKRQLVELLIDRVVVTQEQVEIRYVIPTSLRGEQSRFCHLRIDYFGEHLKPELSAFGFRLPNPETE
ncbi:recombinase family protein [Nodosilinea sp. LEGE 07088]|uniref:recombinase family protein n=1 Tax=Nodosilinea sp. LEGE 07088 TaxID=2777968 RepID=UPI00187DE4A1|nr:recombinase family protein [Nodosilinea sp. LEGE 07088]